MPYIIEKTFNSEIFTKVGNLTITADGIASGFSNSNYLENIPSSYIAGQKIKIEFEYTPNSINTSNNEVLFSTSGLNNSRPIYIARFSNRENISFSIGSNARDTNDLSINQSHKFIYETDGINYCRLSIDGTVYNLTIYNPLSTNDSSFVAYCLMKNNTDARTILGSTDLKQFKITVDDKVVLNGTTSKEVYVLPSIQELKDYYSNTLIVQYNGKPKAKQTIEMLVYLVFSEMLLFQVQNAFNWKTAVGKQLDIIGQWVGVSRTFNINILTEPKLAYPQYDRLDPDTTSALQGGYSDYETFYTLQGGQLRYSDIQTTTNNLNDDNYRIIIGLKIIFNSINHTAKAIDDAIWEYFNHEVYTVWTDNTLTYYYPSNLAQVMLFADYKGVLPAPTGVTVQLTEI